MNPIIIPEKLRRQIDARVAEGIVTADRVWVQREKELQGAIDSQSVLIGFLEQQLAVLRGAIWAMMSQAAKDEVSQDATKNPWIGLKSAYAAKINPLIQKLNKFLGVEAPRPPDGASNSIVVATEG